MSGLWHRWLNIYCNKLFMYKYETCYYLLLNDIQIQYDYEIHNKRN